MAAAMKAGANGGIKAAMAAIKSGDMAKAMEEFNNSGLEKTLREAVAKNVEDDIMRDIMAILESRDADEDVEMDGKKVDVEVMGDCKCGDG